MSVIGNSPESPSPQNVVSAGVDNGFVSKWILRRPGWLFYAILLLATLLTCTTGLLTIALPAWELRYVAYLIYVLWLGLGAAWVVRAGAALLARIAGTPRARQPGMQWPGWVLAPIIMAVTALNFGYRAQFHTRFWLSRPALEAFAQHVATAPPDVRQPNQKIGRFQAADVEQIPGTPGGVRFRTDVGGHWLDWNGLAYSPTPLPEQGPPEADKPRWYYTPLVDRWYTVSKY